MLFVGFCFFNTSFAVAYMHPTLLSMLKCNSTCFTVLVTMLTSVALQSIHVIFLGPATMYYLLTCVHDCLQFVYVWITHIF